MPAFRAKTDDGQVLHVHIPQFLAWVLGLCGTAIVAGVALLLNLNMRVTAIESTRFTAKDAEAITNQFVPRAEYNARWGTAVDRLDRIEDKLDRLLEAR